MYLEYLDMVIFHPLEEKKEKKHLNNFLVGNHFLWLK